MSLSVGGCFSDVRSRLGRLDEDRLPRRRDAHEVAEPEAEGFLSSDLDDPTEAAEAERGGVRRASGFPGEEAASFMARVRSSWSASL